jgi:hypothetical protein
MGAVEATAASGLDAFCDFFEALDRRLPADLPAQSALSRPPSSPSQGPRKRGRVEPAPSMLSRYSASAWPRPDRRQAGQHPLANGFRILAQCLAAQTWAAPETQNRCRRLDSEFNRLDGQKSAWVPQLPARSPTQEMDLLHVTLYFESKTSRTTALHSAGRRMHFTRVARGSSFCWQLLSAASPHKLRPSTRDYGASQRILLSADESLVVSQVSHRTSSQLKRDCADLRQRSRSIIAASQTNSLAPMGLDLEAAGRK